MQTSEIKVDTTEMPQAVPMPVMESPALPKPTAEEAKRQQAATEQDAKKAQEIRDSLDPNAKIKAAYQETLNQNQENLTKHLQDLLKEYGESKTETKRTELKVQFEATIEYCIEKGKSFPENVLFCLMAGIIDGLVDAKHVAHYSTYLKSFPALQYLFQDADEAENYKKIWGIAKKYFNEDLTKGEMGKDFQNFYWTVVMGDLKVQERTEEDAHEHLIDHDYIGGIAAAGDSKMMRELLSAQDGKDKPTTAVENIYAGNVMWLEENRGFVFKNPKGASRGVADFLMTDGILSGAAYKNDQRPRFNEEILNAVPRMAALTNHPNMALKELRERIWGAVMELDPTLFMAMKDYDEKKFPIIQKRLASYGFKDIQTIDQVYDNLDKILEKIVKPGRLASIFGKFRRFANKLKP